MPPPAIRASELTATHSPRAFATTHWSLVIRARGDGTADSQEALEILCRKYWHPLYWFARYQGISQADAEDLTQGFFEDILRRQAITRADKTRGRFRTFLLTSFRNFQSHEWKRAGRVKRGGGRQIVSLDAMREAEAHTPKEPATTDTPEKVFDRKWALHLLDHVLNSLEREYARVGRIDLFKEISTSLEGGPAKSTYADIAKRLGSTEGAIKIAVHRLRKRFREELRQEVAMTVENPDDIDDELRHLFAAMGS